MSESVTAWGRHYAPSDVNIQIDGSTNPWWKLVRFSQLKFFLSNKDASRFFCRWSLVEQNVKRSVFKIAFFKPATFFSRTRASWPVCVNSKLSCRSWKWRRASLQRRRKSSRLVYSSTVACQLINGHFVYWSTCQLTLFHANSSIAINPSMACPWA